MGGTIPVSGTLLSVGSYSVLSSFSKPCTDKVRTSSRHSQREDPRLSSTCSLQFNAAIIIKRYTEDITRARPATTNGNERAHRNINRDGVNLTLLGGRAFDDRAAQSIDVHVSLGIGTRDRDSTHVTVHREVSLVKVCMHLHSHHSIFNNNGR
ncbi:hypothetical protein DFJ58DRAFT_91415 [Suillus subalutaceus]|uniref:uncharacterized protein n=1 Tax=Suillus subalutaceus TaxID=48586 RepID=UPI001B8728A3|nr:uncharacterized protein DFJ58DRAFT_91415 [Suillus subalutaceus]KAG1840477.1 hypothetical protein DFJ58DRAFT_91415 [Suillus subalutaceus]